MAMPPPKRIEMGHFTRFLGRLHYPQSWGTRPSPGEKAKSVRLTSEGQPWASQLAGSGA